MSFPHFGSFRRKSVLLALLLLVGAVGWFSPTMASTRRSRKGLAVPSVSARDVILPVGSTTSELCVRGTSISPSDRVAVIDSRVLAVGQQIAWEGKAFQVIAIEPDSVRLVEVRDDHPAPSITNESARQR